jgi:hypothetical protein
MKRRGRSGLSHERVSSAGADFHSVARLTYYIVNYLPGHLPAIRSVRDRFINLEKPPASTLTSQSKNLRRTSAQQATSIRSPDL